MIARQPYTGHALLDDRLEEARVKAERDGRLRYVAASGIYFKPRRDCIVMGSEDWAAIEDGHWKHKKYSSEEGE